MKDENEKENKPLHMNITMCSAKNQIRPKQSD